MRTLLATMTMMMFVVGACVSTPRYRTTPTSAEAVRAVLTTGATTIRDAHGDNLQLSDGWMVQLSDPWSGTIRMSIESLAHMCRDPSKGCPLERRESQVKMVIEDGHDYHFEAAAIAWPLLGAVVIGEAICFAACSTRVKIGVGVADAVSVLAIVYALSQWAHHVVQ